VKISANKHPWRFAIGASGRQIYQMTETGSKTPSYTYANWWWKSLNTKV
jgi:hypothetical protein